MKFSVSRNQLLRAMQHTLLKAPRSIYLCANHYMMSVTGKSLFVTGVNPTDRVFITETVILDNEPTELGVTAAPFVVHNGILRALKSLDEQQLEFNVEGWQMTVRHEHGYFRVPLVDVSFPDAITLQQEGLIRINMEAPGLYSALFKVSFAAADDEMRPSLSGVFVEITREHINYVASNAHILISLAQARTEPDKTGCSFIIPKHIAEVIQKILPKTGYCELSYSNGLASIKIDDNLHIDFECTDSRYPNYKKVIPETGFHTTLKVDRRSMIKSINRLYLFSSSSTRGVKLSLNNQEPNILMLGSQDIEGDAIGQEKIACDVLDGAGEFGQGLLFRIPLLAGILSHIPSDKVIFKSTGSNSGCLMSFESTPKLENVTALIMPMLQSD